MDIIRNVGIREHVQHGGSKITDTDINTLAMKINDTRLVRSSLPNLVMKSMYDGTQQSNESIVHNKDRDSADILAQSRANNDAVVDDEAEDDVDDEEECAISGRLEIRVVQQSHEQQHKSSPNREESVYFDAVAGSAGAEDSKVSRRLVNKVYANEQSSPIDSNDIADGNGDETAFYSTTTARIDNQSSVQRALHGTRSDSNPMSGDADNRLASMNENMDKSSNVTDDMPAGLARPLCNANDSASTINNKEFPVASSLSLYPNQTAATTAIDQTTVNVAALTTAATTINKPITDQSDALPTSPNVSHSNSNSNLNPYAANDRKDTATNNSISTINNSSHNNSKIPVLNPNARTAKCASWAGTDLSLTTNLNELTPGNRHIARCSHTHIHAFHFPSLSLYMYISLSLCLTHKHTIL